MPEAAKPMRRRLLGPAVLIGGALWLGACALAPQKPSVARAAPAPLESPQPPKPDIAVAPTPPENPPPPTTPPVPKTPPAKAKPEAKPPPVQAAVVTPPPVAKPAPPPPPPPPTAQDVLDLDPVALTALLQSPRLKRQEAPAEVWQYFASHCVLHVFLYPAAQGAGLSVDHLEATDTSGAKSPTDDCLAELAAAKRTVAP